MIRFENVTKKFGGQSNALSNITVTIKDGEFVFLIGQSGAGKTTFLRLLIHDILPTEGSVYVDDWRVDTMHPSSVYLLRRKLGTVFQDFKLLIDRTVFENVALGLEILGKNEDETAGRVGDVLELVGLSSKRDSFPLQLSAGEMQRTSIARAIVGGPSVILADEPTGNLDPQTSWDILDILREVNKIGTTVIMATHNASIVNDLRKRTVTLDKGEIVNDEEKGQYRMSHKQKSAPKSHHHGDKEEHHTKKEHESHS